MVLMREIREQFHLLYAVRVLCNSSVRDLTIDERHQLRRFEGILWPSWAQPAIGVQVCRKVDQVVRQISPAVGVQNIRGVNRAKYR